MTAQIPDQLLYRGRTFQLAGVNGSSLFDPAAHGLRVLPVSSACWRGFRATYLIEDEQLYLDRLEIGLRDEDAFVLFGKLPIPLESHPAGKYVYQDLRAEVDFSGGLLAAEGFIRELYVHTGFHPAWKYREVHELIFEGGRLLSANDASRALEAIRERLAASTGDDLELRASIQGALALEY